MADSPTPPRRPAPNIQPVFIWPSPNNQDYLFYVEKDGRLPANKVFSYGSAYPDATRYPGHRLVFVSQQSEEKWSRWFYASDRINQDAYNWELTTGNELVRTYFVERSTYAGGGFSPPLAATLDAAFPAYGFADDTQKRTETELDSTFVIIQRRYIEPVVNELKFLSDYQKFLKVTREVIPVWDGSTLPTPAVGSRVEIQHANAYHDLRITYALQDLTGASWLASTTPRSVDIKLPPKLLSVDVNWMSAFADSTDAPTSRDEDFYIHYEIVNPRPGPYQATTYIYYATAAGVTALLTANPTNPPPQPARETLAVMYAWFYASTKGNSTRAYAKEWEIPETVHDEITVSVAGAGSGLPALGSRSFVVNGSTGSPVLAATPGYLTFSALTEMTLPADVQQVDFNLYKVAITKVNVTGVYD